MSVGTSIVLIAVGAILKFAVTATVSGIDLATVGLILLIVGIAGLAISLVWLGAFADRRAAAAPPVADPPVVREREIY
ncbi:MAG: hypothetical protein QOE27_1827 [Solirubrobacteraceae bacterium]|jgi:hypothetical protein|nr:hypothetical protein [Solirubrobacteraceae bacterium]